jgi:EmrB/QacA subfamily drug resistance transporter
VLCLSLLIVFVGNSSLNVTIPTLSRELNASNSQLQWVIAAYSLVFAGLLFTTGALGDRYGRKGALQLGLVIYLVACVAATASDAMWQLIACRAVMGVGAALIMPSTLSILVNVFPPHERTKAIAIWASVTGAAGAIGPVASGWLLGHFWYGSVFLVNVPILVLALAAGWFLVPKSRDPEQGALDPIGALFSIVGITALVYGLIQAPQIGWRSGETIAAFVIALVVLVVFVRWELRVAEPMLDMRFFANPAFSTGTGGMILIFLSMFGVMFLITQYFQLILGYSPLGAAMRLLPMAPIMILVSPMTPRLSARFGANRVVAAGMSSVALGLLMFRGLTPHTSYWYVLLSIIPLVSGIALSMSPMTASIMSAVPARRAGAGSAMNDATRELGAALGIALMGSLAASRYTVSLASATAGLPANVKHQANVSLADALAAVRSALLPTTRSSRGFSSR